MTDVANLQTKLQNHLSLLFEEVYQQAHITAERSHTAFERAFEQYLSYLQPVVDRYQHHQGSSVSETSFRQRFISETAILYTLTHMIQRLSAKDNWPLFHADSIFAWFPQQSIYTELEEDFMGDSVILDTRTILNLTNYADQLLSQSGHRYLGEFYTPFDLTQHIVDLLNFNPEDLFEGARVIDPACGGGNVLAELLIRTLAFHRHHANAETTELLEDISATFYGYDIQPYAIVLTKTLLQFILLILLDYPDDWDEHASDIFQNVKIIDPLATYNEFWSTEATQFRYIVGNPPFMSVKKEEIPYINAYACVLSGHPNLYVMFLWWAIQAAEPNGKISFLLPQSMLAGPYFSALRTQIEQHTRLISLTRLLDRKGVVGSADQQMMVVALEKTNQRHPDGSIAVRVVRNGSAITGASALYLPYDRVVYREHDNILWQISNNELDFQILACLANVSQELSQLGVYQVGNGSFVWNQHKELIRARRVKNSLPLISSASVGMYEFEFPYTGSHPTNERPFALVRGEKVFNKRHFTPILLVKRTTPKKVGRRLLCAMPPESFFAQYPTFFVENHVNYVKVLHQGHQDMLLGLMAWLNSDLINFVFQLRNGTTQVSVFEMKALPISQTIVTDLISLGRQLRDCTSSDERVRLGEAVNEQIFKWLELSPSHIKRIKTVVARTERMEHKYD